MTPAEIAELVTAAAALMGAAAAYLHSRTTRQAVRTHVQMHERNSISIVRQQEGGSDDAGQANPGRTR